MLKVHPFCIRAGIAIAGLLLATPSHGATPASSPAYQRCMDHYSMEWRDWEVVQDRKRQAEQETLTKQAEDQAAAWDKLATSPGIDAPLAIDYRQKAQQLRTRAQNSEHDATGADPQSNKDLSEFCEEVVAVLAPTPSQNLTPPTTGQTAKAKPRKKLRTAAKPRRIRRARTVQRLRTRPRLSVGIGFVGIGF